MIFKQLQIFLIFFEKSIIFSKYDVYLQYEIKTITINRPVQVVKIGDKEMKTIQEQIKTRIERMVSNKELDNLNKMVNFLNQFDDIFEEIANTDERLYFINRKNSNGYCTWSITLELNQYHFGYKLANALQTAITTHDEDKKFTLKDFEDLLKENFSEYINDICQQLPLFTGDNEEEIMKTIEKLFE